jgi:hypothetical protein
MMPEGKMTVRGGMRALEIEYAISSAIDQYKVTYDAQEMPAKGQEAMVCRKKQAGAGLVKTFKDPQSFWTA